VVAKKPEERFPSMAEVMQALEGLALPAEPAAPPGGAATVEIIPATPARAPTASSGQTVDLPAARPAVPAAARTTVLLVEPSRSQAVIIRSYLQKLGPHDVSTVPSGHAALESARSAPPNVVISAMHLADMSGIQLAQKMRAEASLS